jgi:hypothetical protein
MIPTYAVIPTYNKSAQLLRLLHDLSTLHGVVVLENSDSDFVNKLLLPTNCVLIPAPIRPPNLSLLWNIGLDIVASMARARSSVKWNVAVLNDDATLPDSGWCQRLGESLRKSPAAVACGTSENRNRLLTEDSPWTLAHRLCGWAHISKGELGLRFDEDLRWWYGDTAYDKEARKSGGTLLVAGEYVGNTDADVSTHSNPELYEQAGKDRNRYIEKWGDPGW